MAGNRDASTRPGYPYSVVSDNTLKNKSLYPSPHTSPCSPSICATSSSLMAAISAMTGMAMPCL